MKWQSMLKVILVNLLLIFIGLVTVELLFGTWFSDVHALYQFTKPRSIRIVQQNPFFGHPAKLIYTRDMNGFRGLVTPVDRITIITVGGSTTDQRFIDDSVTFQTHLQGVMSKTN